ncbi:glycosyl hydrolase 53 family protein [Kribbella sp. NPDC050281]|uniref:glycosyl hydrolase 53 family protein n=1 Tax=Kribbella sp. NPDC050281 TaxID=3155515 RepID=UPI0033DB6782
MRPTHLLRSVTALVVLAAITSPQPAAGIGGTATINPIASDIAAKFWSSVQVSSGSATAALAKDQDEATAWIADNRGPGQWLTLDLGGGYDAIRKVEVVFPDAGATYRYVVEASRDNSHWAAIADHSRSTVAARGAVDLVHREGIRYLRVRIIGTSPGATVGISEIRAFNYLRDDLVNGADMSYADQHQGQNFYVNPNPSMENMGAGPDLLDVAADRGMQYTRLRVWNEPRDESSGLPTSPAYQGPDRTAAVAKTVVAHGMKLGIDFHYADSWADPGKQPKPRAWAQLTFPELQQAMDKFTYDYVRRLVRQGTRPDKVAVGNEVINGFLYGSEAAEIGTTSPPYFDRDKDIYQSQPGGGLLWKYWKSTVPEEQVKYNQAWDRFAALMATGISAVRKASPSTKVEIHAIVDKDRLDKTMEFWQQLLPRLKARGVNPDVLALSYYPEWHGSPDELDLYLHTMATTLGNYRLEISETSYPASGEGGAPMPNSTFPRTVQGQADALQRVIQAANDIVDNKGLGMLVWEPADWQSMFRAVPGMPGYFEPYASIDIFAKSAAKNILQDKVYLTAKAGSTPRLPHNVTVMRVKDNVVRSTPVKWSQPDPQGTRYSITGQTAYGPVTAIVDVLT